MRALIRVADERAVLLGSLAYKACSRASSTKSVRMELLTRQPTMLRAKTSITKTTYSQPCQVETQVKSLTHSGFGRLALNYRLTPLRPRRRMSRSTVQRATGKLSRLICCQTLSAP